MLWQGGGWGKMCNQAIGGSDETTQIRWNGNTLRRGTRRCRGGTIHFRHGRGPRGGVDASQGAMRRNQCLQGKERMLVGKERLPGAERVQGAGVGFIDREGVHGQGRDDKQRLAAFRPGFSHGATGWRIPGFEAPRVAAKETREEPILWRKGFRIFGFVFESCICEVRPGCRRAASEHPHPDNLHPKAHGPETVPSERSRSDMGIFPNVSRESVPVPGINLPWAASRQGGTAERHAGSSIGEGGG